MECPLCILETQEGKKFASPFKQLKIEHLLNSGTSDEVSYWVEILNVIPKDWLYEAYRKIWKTTLDINNFKNLQ